MWPPTNPRNANRLFQRLGVITLALVVVFTFLPGLLRASGLVAPVEAATPGAIWEFVDDVPGSGEGFTPRRVWTAERDVVYVLTARSSPSVDSAVWRYDHGIWHQELDVPGFAATVLFGTAPDEIFAAFYSNPVTRLYRYDGVSWTIETLPPQIGPIYTIAGVPGDVQVGSGSRVARNTGSGWSVVPHNPSINVGPRLLTYAAPTDAYMASCWGHGWWDGVTWNKKVEFDFCDVADMWGARTETGDLKLWVVGNNNFANGIRIWRYDEATRSFGGKYAAEVMDPPGTAHRTGQATGIWGSGPDDVYVSGYRWDTYPTDAHAVVYHYDGTGWTSVIDFGTGGPLPLRMWDVWGSASDDVWFVLEDGRLMHYGTPLYTPPPQIWEFVDTLPGADDGRFAREIWTGERDVVYVLTTLSSVPFNAEVWRYDHGTWHFELDLTGHYGNFVFGTAPDDIYAGGYTCLQPDGSWTCPAGGADASPVFHFDGATWTQLSLPPELDGRNVHSIAGVPGEVQLGANPYVVRDTGSGWAIVYDARSGYLTVGPSVMAMVAPDEGYFASCWGHARWDGVTWTKKIEFDFCDLYDIWGARTGTGDLSLWAAGNNNFQNGVRIWRYDEGAHSFGAKYTPEFADPLPATDTSHLVGTALALWGAAPDDVYAAGCMWEGTSGCNFGRIYHSTGDGTWTGLNEMGAIAGATDVWGTAADDVWFSLNDGQLLHYGAPLTIGRNQAPTAADDAGGIDEDSRLELRAPGVLGNDDDVDGDPLSAVLRSDVSHGTLTLQSDGAFIYEPNADFDGTDTFTYVAFDGALESDTATVTITVNPVNDPPLADAGGPYASDEGSPVSLAATGSWDIDDAIVAYEWDLDEDGEYDDANGVLVSPSFPDDGFFTIGLRVTDSFGDFDTDTTTVTVTNVQPTIALQGSPVPVDEGAVFTLTLGAVTDPGDDTVTDFVVHWGDGSTYTYADAGLKTHVYADGNASPTITIDLVDEDGTYTGVASLMVQVYNVAPAARVDPRSQTVQYSDAIADVTVTAGDVEADPLTLSTSWSVDGGGFVAGLPASLTMTQVDCSVALSEQTCWCLAGIMDVPAGVYTVRVTVADDDGATTISDITITVEPEVVTVAFPESPDQNPVAVQVAEPSGASGPFQLTVLVSETDPDAPIGAAAAGDIGLAEVSMTLAPVGPGGSASPSECTNAVAGAGYDGVLTVTCSFDGVDVNTYVVTVTVDGGYFTGSNEDVLVVYDPSLGFTTGGGWFYWPETDDKTNFGYTMKYNKKGHKVQGSFLLIRHLDDGTKYRVKSNALYGLALGAADGMGWASFSGKSTYLQPGWEDPKGNHEFVVYVEDHGEPGAGVDRVWLEMHDTDRDVIPALSMDRAAADNAATLSGGNIVVPH